MFDFLQQAEKMNSEIHSAKWQDEISGYLGKYYYKTGDKKRGDEYFRQITDDINNSRDLLTQIKCWGKLAGNIRALDTIGLTRINCLEKMIDLYWQLNNSEKVIEMEKAIADTHLKQGKLDIAESELFQVLAKYKSIGFKNLHYTYNLLASKSHLKGNYNSALHYTLLTIESMRQTKDTSEIVNFYCHLAHIYDEIGQAQKCIDQFKILFHRKFTNPIDFYTLREAGIFALVLIKQKKEKEALDFILGFTKEISGPAWQEHWPFVIFP